MTITLGIPSKGRLREQSLELLARAGLAVALPFVTRDYEADERAAREARRGLWAGVFDTPASWRRQHPDAVLP
jgi:endonuclease YncB( thermonuclease family)